MRERQYDWALKQVMGNEKWKIRKWNLDRRKTWLIERRNNEWTERKRMDRKKQLKIQCEIKGQKTEWTEKIIYRSKIHSESNHQFLLSPWGIPNSFEYSELESSGQIKLSCTPTEHQNRKRCCISGASAMFNLNADSTAIEKVFNRIVQFNRINQSLSGLLPWTLEAAET